MNKVYAKNNYRIKVDYSEEIQSITLRNKLRNRRKILIEPQVYIIHDVPVFFPRWIFQVPIKTPKFGTLKVIKYG